MKPEYNFQQVSTHYQELEQLLYRIERSKTHYEALGVTVSATDELIEMAYKEAVALLHPCGHKISLIAAEAPDNQGERFLSKDLIRRIDRAFSRASQAFSVLMSSDKRREYDSLLCHEPGNPLSRSAKPSGFGNAIATQIAALPPALSAIQQVIEAPGPPPPDDMSDDAASDISSEAAAEANRRRNERFNLCLPTHVTGHDRKKGRWDEETQTIDVSRTGVTLAITKRVRHGMILHLSLPLPTRLRSFGHSEPMYSVYAMVRRVEPAKKGSRVIGLEFVSERAPEGYSDKPWATFRTKKWAGAERRRRLRQQRSDVVWVQYFTEDMQCVKTEAARTENVSRGGIRLFVRAAPVEFEMVKVIYPDRGIESFAAVCNRYISEDGFERLCLRFLDTNRIADLTHSQAEAGPDQAEAKADVIKKQEDPPRKARKILVADDDPPLRKVLGMILTQAGYEVVLVEDGKAAVEKASTEKPDLVITDGLMPKMHGFLACKAIKEMASPPRVIMLTAVYTRLSYKWEAKEAYGADDLLTKPFEVSELLACIEKQLSRSPCA